MVNEFIETGDGISLRDVALKQIETTKEVYKLSPRRMFSEYNGERENIKNYNGRQLLEMLQNADDASLEAIPGNRKVLIRLEGIYLTIANTGYPFSEEGLNSIFLSHLSPKEAMEKQIGKKGLGFRSILSWATEVTIKSQDLCVAFSEKYSKVLLEELLTAPLFKKEFDKINKGLSCPIATLVCPNLSEAYISPFSGMEEYDTIVQIALNELAKPELLNQIKNDLDGEVLLFLNNLEQIVLDIDGAKSIYEKKNTADHSRCCISHTTKSGVSNKEWNIYILEGRFPELDRPYGLSIAWQDDFEGSKDVFYSYFRTKVSVKSKGIIHGSFELNADRNLIIKDDEGYNARLLDLIPDLLTGAADFIAKNDQVVSYKPISILQIESPSISHLVEISKLKSNIIAKSKEKSILPVTSGRYIRWNGEDLPVYYDEEVFARHLEPEEFPDLMLHTSDSETKLFLDDLRYARYSIKDTINNLSRLRDTISTEEYAYVITSIHKYIKDPKEYVDASLFHDDEFSLFDFTKPIFFPSDHRYSLPATMGVQIMSSDLAEKLLSVTCSKTYAEVAGKLQFFRLKEFNFKEVVELLVQYYAESDSLGKLSELHRYLFMLYQREKPVEVVWSGSDIPMLNKKNKKQSTKQLYFGKEYDNQLVEEIYSYDKSKIVCALQKLDVPADSYDQWLKYCEWLGVSRLPRIVSEKADIHYAEFVMRNFDYKHSIGDFNFKNGYVQFKQELTNGYGSIRVKSIDDLINILEHNAPEKILLLLSQHTSVLQFIEKDIEPSDSHIQFCFYRQQSPRAISGGLMKSYIKWILRNYNWLETESGIKSAPDKCCTAAYITDDFRGLVEKPLLEYEALRYKGITREKAEYLLSMIGVHKGINTFSTNMLYSILLSLPEKDTKGKKTKTIYNQIAANFDERQTEKIDKSDNYYKKFKKEGLVFCQDGAFHPINTVYYVNDKRYGETIIKEFNTIAIDRRRGKEKIRELFGVAPLEGLDLQLAALPTDHSLNIPFEKEIELFKPFVYVLRKDVDAGSEKGRIKDLKFRLVSDIQIRLNTTDDSRELPLHNYDYLYVREKNLVYLKSEGAYENLQELREDVLFCSAVAEIFSGVLDVDFLRQQIRELFSKTLSSREALLETEFDSKSVQQLQDARQILGIANDPKIDFWSAYCSCLKKRRKIDGSWTDATLLEFLKNQFSTLNQTIEEHYDEIIYSNLNDEQTIRRVVNLLQQSRITISQFNKYIYPSIDLSPIYDLDFKREKSNQKERFKHAIYSACLEHRFSFDDFLNKINRYDSIQPNIVNEADYNVYDDLNNQTQQLFGVDLKGQFMAIDLNNLYQQNIGRLTQHNSQLCTESLIMQFIRENRRAESLLYFESTLLDISALLSKWLEKQRSSTESSSGPLKGKRISVGGQVLTFENYKDLYRQIDQIFTKEALSGIEAREIQTQRKGVKRLGTGSGAKKQFGRGAKSRELSEELGFIGEFIIYKHLVEIAEPESVKWVSEYAKLCGHSSDGKDGWGYDFEYVPKGRKTPRYAEVKVVGEDNSFHMSSNEVKTGEQYRKHYDLFLVRNTDDFAKTKIENIRNIFDYAKGATFTENDRFSVLNDNFIIRFNIK